MTDSTPSGEVRLLLETLPFFSDLSHDQFVRLASRSRIRPFKAGEMIAREDEPVRAFYLLVSGRAKIFKISPEGREQTLYVFGPGEPFCLCAAFGESGFPANAASLEPCRVLVVPADALEDLAREVPGLLFNFLAVLSRRLKDVMRLVETLTMREIPQRVAAFILHTAGEGGPEAEAEGTTIELRITQRELAKILGSTPEALNRALKRMQGDGLLEVHGRSLRVLDLPGIEALAVGE